MENPLREARIGGMSYIKVGISAPVAGLCAQDDPDTISRPKTGRDEWLLLIRCREMGKR